MLVFDGHSSHLTDDIRELALKHNIELFCLPPHTTHKLQPLDVGCFGPLQNAWRKRCDSVLTETGSEIPKHEFIREYMVVRNEVFSRPGLVKKAWQRSGLNPINADMFNDDDYAPSVATSIRAHVPSTFPCGNPGSIQINGGAHQSNEAEISEDFEAGLEGDIGWDCDEGKENDNNNESEDEETVQLLSQQQLTPLSHGGYTETGEAPPLTPACATSPPFSPWCTRSTASTLGLSPTPFLPSWSLQRKLDAAVAMNQQLLSENQSLTADLEIRQAHCTLAYEQIEDLQKKLNGSKKKTKECTINVGSMGITSAEGLLLWEKEKAARAEKERLKAERAQRHEERETAAQAVRAAHGPITAFGGSLGHKSKPDLLELADALGISLEDARNNQERSEHIQSHLDTHLNLKDNPRFTGLYVRAIRSPKRTHAMLTANDENELPHSHSSSGVSEPRPTPMSPETHSRFIEHHHAEFFMSVAGPSNLHFDESVHRCHELDQQYHGSESQALSPQRRRL